MPTSVMPKGVEHIRTQDTIGSTEIPHAHLCDAERR